MLAAVDHDFDNVAGAHRYGSGCVSKLRKWRYAVGFVADINEYFLPGNLQHPSFENLVPGRRRQVAVIF